MNASRGTPGLLGISAMLCIAGATHAQSLQGGSSSIDHLRSGSVSGFRFHPEHGEVRISELHSFGAARPELPLDPHLSIFVTDVETVSQLRFSEVMEQLVRRGGHKGQTRLELFNQWWDTAAQSPGLGLGPHCDDESAPVPPTDGPPALATRNGFPYACPRLESSEAKSDPFKDESATNGYSAIAFSNRFDLIGPDVADPKEPWRLITPDCGEYRVVFARNSGKTDNLMRNLIIFEARVPNPQPRAGQAGCKVILDFWHGLSDRSITATKRGQLLKDFYLHGLPHHHVRPVVDPANYTFGSGQIRTNQFFNDAGNHAPPSPLAWTLREFKMVQQTDGSAAIVPDSVKTNPGNDLFAAKSVDPRAADLTQQIRAQLPKIAGHGLSASSPADLVNAIGFNVGGDGINAFESDERRAEIGDVSVAYFGGTGGTTENSALQQAIQAAITSQGLATLTPAQVISRVKTQTCAGCHHYSDPGQHVVGLPNVHVDLGGGAVWPAKADGDAGHPTNGLTHPPMDFTQESELDADRQPAIVGTGLRYATSLTVETFLVARTAFMKKALGLP
jgi:hypothetical protein